jgi:hypothetical protein
MIPLLHFAVHTKWGLLIDGSGVEGKPEAFRRTVDIV